MFRPPPLTDPRWAFGSLLTLYGVLGFASFGFNRSPWQMLFIVVSGALLEAVYCRVTRGSAIFPLSAWISCCSLALLLNYGHGSILPFLPVLITIAGKHILTVNGRHVYNPSMFAVATCLLVGRDMITAAAAYQWDGNAITVTFFLITAALAMFVFRIGRTWLIVSFLTFYAIQTGIRAFIMRHHLPPEMLFIGTMTTPPFFLFTMYMITDPGTSPKSPKQQVVIAFLIAIIDLALHAKESVFTFFYAALTVATGRFLLSHFQRARALGATRYVHEELLSPLRLRAIALTLVIGAIYAGVGVMRETHSRTPPVFSFEDVETPSLMTKPMSGLLAQTDPRLHHISKWLLSVGDSVAVGDVDGDGALDVFLTNVLKHEDDRAGIYLNKGNFQFERIDVPALQELAKNFKTRGVAGGGAFVDYDGDGDDDLFVAVAFGKSMLLKNLRVETGEVAFEDVSKAVGLDEHTVSLGALFFDVDNDADLDLLIMNATTPVLFGYDTPTPLNIFELPQPAYDGDRRMFQFMHNGWHNADNGGQNVFYKNEGGVFVKQDNTAWNLTQTHWSLAGVAVDFNHDGYVDLYIANDFGPDDVYLNEGGKTFRHHKGGRLFNTVGNDTYKGMNASAADYDRNGFIDVYISNVHQPLQAEGSLLWMLYPSDDPFVPRFSDEATKRGALNEKRFAWGAAAGDLDFDGYHDLVQTNGMVDDRLDPLIKDGERKDYWYVSHKLMQSGPDIHTYADQWGDIRGRTIFPNEALRVYRNLGAEAPGYFTDVAALVNLENPDNSRGVLLADLDGDLDLDVMIANQHGKTLVKKNTLREHTKRTALCVRLQGDGTRSHRSGLGARLTFTHDGVTYLEENTLMGGFSAQREPYLRVGFGDSTPPDVKATVRWPGGQSEDVTIPVGRCVTVVQGKGIVDTP